MKFQFSGCYFSSSTFVRSFFASILYAQMQNNKLIKKENNKKSRIVTQNACGFYCFCLKIPFSCCALKNRLNRFLSGLFLQEGYPHIVQFGRFFGLLLGKWFIVYCKKLNDFLRKWFDILGFNWSLWIFWVCLWMCCRHDWGYFMSISLKKIKKDPLEAFFHNLYLIIWDSNPHLSKPNKIN